MGSNERGKRWPVAATGQTNEADSICGFVLNHTYLYTGEAEEVPPALHTIRHGRKLPDDFLRVAPAGADRP